MAGCFKAGAAIAPYNRSTSIRLLPTRTRTFHLQPRCNAANCESCSPLGTLTPLGLTLITFLDIIIEQFVLISSEQRSDGYSQCITLRPE